ncbi:MAG: aminotransferase class I/II-fold pyridoxal phosphate-dependent enzyme [candidate division WOR-3 bacterium]|nr:MAG: aminotransferase class I/II-fold pyridoxal phosphate-dependent enzyme [candidate division WOR-3 bacterium]
MHIDSKIVHGGQHPDKETGALSPPIFQTSTFAFRDADHGARLFNQEESGYIYTRLSNPTSDLLAKKIALLESTDAGVLFASGLSAVFNLVITVAQAGDHVVSDDTIYGGTFALFKTIMPRLGITVTFVNTADIDALSRAITDKTKLIFTETPANPTMKIVDIAACAALAKKNHALLCVDNTFATPYLQRPVELGADIVLHSMTKYFGGHGDIIGGAVVGSKEFIHELWENAKEIGGCISPFNAWLVLRGLKTLAVRMDRHSKSAQKIAEYLSRHKKVERVYFPGLSSHPGHDLAKKQMSDFGGMLGFDLKGGKEAGKVLMNSVKLCILAVSLGDVDTLIEHPASMTHSTYTDEELRACGITAGFVRLSVGLEHVDDIIDDLEQAMANI